jgi:iron complex transport system substrate-binding protein
MIKKLIIIAAVVFSLSGCTGRSGREILDRSGRTLTITGPVNRIVSTAPSNTEIIVDLGMADKLVAVDRHSADIGGVPPGLPALDFFYPDAETLIGLEPDIIIANGHNATGSGDDPLKLIREAGIAVAYISMSKSVNDIYNDIAFVADVLQVPDRGDELVRSMKAGIDKLAQRTAAAAVKRSVYLEVSAAPDMLSFGKESYINDMITVIGARNIFENDNWIVTPSAEAIIDRNPDVILTAVDYLDDPIGELRNRYGFEHINAVKYNRIYQIDTNSLVRPSARILTALDQMARAVYPELYE